MCISAPRYRYGADTLKEFERAPDAPRVYGHAVTPEHTPCVSIQRGKLKDMPKRSLIGVDGLWYDVTAFKKYHPGGDIIEEWVGMDATQIFHAWHAPAVLAKRKPVGTYDIAKLAPHTQDPFEMDMRLLQTRLEKEGWFYCDKWWWTRKTAIIFALLGAAHVCVASSNFWMRYGLGVAFMTAFWQQSGFMMHDAMHSQHFDTLKSNKWAGIFFGTICFGISGRWWRDEHYEHHSFTCTVNEDTGVSDPQFDEQVWACHNAVFPYRRNFLHKVCVTLQDYIWVPIILVAGRFAIIIDSYKEERRPEELAAIAVHWAVVALPLCFNFDSALDYIIWYAMASTLEGVLHVQLVISHLAMPHQDKTDTKSIGWFRWQITTTYNITNPRWMDWFHGGLNFHMVHHIWPRMPRTNYVKAQELIDEVCAKHGVPTYKASFLELLEICTDNFRKQKKSYFEFVREIDYRH